MNIQKKSKPGGYVNIKEYSKPGGYLRGYFRRPKDGKILVFAEEHNVICRSFRESLAKMAAGQDTEVLKDAVVASLCVDDLGIDGEGNVIVPDENDNIALPLFEKPITSISYAGNSVTFVTVLADTDANGYNISRAMMKSESGLPVALKCFQPMEKKSSWEMIFEWTIVF